MRRLLDLILIKRLMICGQVDEGEGSGEKLVVIKAVYAWPLLSVMS